MAAELIPLDLSGSFLLETEVFSDCRGAFRRIWCAREFETVGISAAISQTSLSFNQEAGTLRGMHFQLSPYEEAKWVTCLRGSLYDVILDLRRNSPTFGRWLSIVLSADRPRTLFVPKGFAHGYQTLEDNTELLYHISGFYSPEYSGGIRWDDPMFNISWPECPRRIVSERDRSFSDYIP